MSPGVAPVAMQIPLLIGRARCFFSLSKGVAAQLAPGLTLVCAPRVPDRFGAYLVNRSSIACALSWISLRHGVVAEKATEAKRVSCTGDVEHIATHALRASVRCDAESSCDLQLCSENDRDLPFENPALAIDWNHEERGDTGMGPSDLP